MALQDSTLQELKDLTFALIGREYANTTASYGRINSLFNFSAQKAYRASNYWERYLVIGEERGVIDGNIVEQQESSVTYSDAGTSSVNGKYYKGEMSTHGNFHNYYQYDGNGNKIASIGPKDSTSSPVWDLCLIDGETESCLYTNTGSSTLPLTFDSAIGSGSLPLPTGELTDTIDTFLRIYPNDPNLVRSQEQKFVVNSRGATLTSDGGTPQSGLYLDSEGSYYLQPDASNIKNVYVTYKKKLDVDLGAQQSANTKIPAEFMPYMAHLTAYTWQRSVEQNASDSNFQLSLALVNSVLEDELAKISDQNIANSYIVKNVRTNYNQLTI